MADPLNVAVLRLLWAPGPQAPLTRPDQWPDEFFHEVFQASNGWSLRDYWHRCSFGLLQLEFDFSIAPWWRFGDHTQKDLKDDRGGILAAARRVVEEDHGVSLAAYNAVIAFVHAPPSNAGATTGGAVFDQGGSLAFFQHELGHVLGFMHSFGPFVPPPNEYGSLYNDSYCVMGYTGTQSHVVEAPPAFADAALFTGDFWTSDRRPAGASLYRRFTGTPDFVNSGWVQRVEPGDRVWVAALSEADNVTPVVAVLPASKGQAQVTVEYRTKTGDDLGVAPGVVVHSLGAHDVGEGRTEVNPPWFETLIPAQVGASASVLGLHFEIVTVSSGTPGGVEIQTSTEVTHVGAFNEENDHRVAQASVDGQHEPEVQTPIGNITNDGPRRGAGGR